MYSKKSFVFISSVAVYGLDFGHNISENHPLQAVDPYGKSKIEAEKYLKKWSEEKNVNLTILRLPLIIGKNAPGNLNSIKKAIKNRYYFRINDGKAKRSMVLAEDVAKIIIKASEIGGIFNLTDGYHPALREIELKIAKFIALSFCRQFPPE